MATFNSEYELRTIHKIRCQLHHAGLKATSARIVVLKVLLEYDTPVTHSELASRTKPMGYDKATVFRNLSDLCRVKIIRKDRLPGESWKYLVVNTENKGLSDSEAVLENNVS